MSRKPRACRHCGCTWSTPCFGGCCWVSQDECSACRPDLLAQLLTKPRPPRRRRTVKKTRLEADARRLEQRYVTKPGRKKEK